MDSHSEDFKEKNNGIIKRVLLAACISAVILVSLFGGYYIWRQNQIVLSAPQGYSASCSESAALEEASRDWFFSLLAQYQQDYLRPADRIDAYTLKSVRVLENAGRNIVQIDFSFRPHTPDAPSFSGWSVVDQGNGVLECQWVVQYDISPGSEDGTAAYTAASIERPAAYDLEQYNTSGQKERDEYKQEFFSDLPYDPSQYTYKIENKVCSVSFDGGASWTETPLQVDQIDYYVDGHFKYNQLKPGSYVISPQKTAILYGGFNTPLACLYSDDMGKTWDSVQITDAPLYIHNKFLSFPDADNGFIVAGSDKTMSFEMETILKTTDGGETWEKSGNGPRDRLMQSAGFADSQTGFICYPYSEGAESMVYRTQDSGETWEAVKLEIQSEYIPFFTLPEAPVLQDGKLFLRIGEGADSDFEGINKKQLQYASDDMGETWAYVGMLELDSDQPG